MIRREYLMRAGVDSLQQLMEEIPIDRSIVSHITLINAAGTPLFNSAYALKPGTTTTDRAYFIHQKAASEDKLYVSLPKRGRNSGRLVVRLVRRIELPGGWVWRGHIRRRRCGQRDRVFCHDEPRPKKLGNPCRR